ncbi:cyclohexadienyl dehydratase [Endozoicomonas montiporae]|uniref:Cyclohexadienyl dehydratase n=1 Tax=Endozoicomonas montiporae TaxID=1027273 RepID=A0A081N0M1_9GAMM|nr:cyclohexadienyl dehydratase [Endozoicomonas montiporae]
MTSALWTGMTHASSKLQSILKSGELRVGTTGDWDPMTVRNPATNQYQGFDIDLARELAKDMGVELKLVPADWKTLVNGLKANKYDMTTSASKNMKRATVAGFSDSYFSVGTVPVTQKKYLDKYRHWSDINQSGVRVAVTLGTVFEQEAREYFPDATIRTVEAPARDFQELLSGRSEVAVTSNLEARKLVAKYPNLAIVPVSKPRKAKQLSIMLPQDDQVWINYINHWIEMKETQGFFDQLEDKWMQ